MVKKGWGLVLLFLFFSLVIPLFLFAESFLSNSYEAVDANNNFELFVSYKSFHGHGEKNFSDWKYHTILGQPIIGHAFGNNFKADLGYIYMLNFRPTFQDWIPVIKAKDQPTVTIRHPYTNNTLVCEVNFTEYDVGDTVSVIFTWYKNSTDWYNNSETIGEENASVYVQRYNVQFEHWTEDNETINVSSTTSTFFTVNTTAIGNIEPEDTSHYDLWICSVRLFDQLAYSWTWVNSTPLMVYNHKPDYNQNMPTYYEWPEDTDFDFDLGSNFSDIDGDDINWYINWTSRTIGHNYILYPNNITITIDNVTGNVHLHPHANVSGFMYIVFTAVDNNASITRDWYLRNDYGHTNTSVFLLNVTQVNDPPWASDVYIEPAQPSYQSTLTCKYTYNDIESHPENTSVTSYTWYLNDEGTSSWVDLGVNSSTLPSSYFDLDDVIKCAVRVKDIYFDWNNQDKSLWALSYVNSSYVVIGLEEETPQQEDNIVIAVG